MKNLFATILFLPLLVCSSAYAENKPNIIVILVDDMGFSDLGCYGSEIETPNLDKLAADGLRFTNFYNTSRCCPTRAALLTGLYSHQAGVGAMMEKTNKPGYLGNLNRNCVTLAEAIKPAGYTTLMTGKWHVGDDEGMKPVDRGFDRYWGVLHGGGIYFKETLKLKPERVFYKDDTPIEAPDDLYVTDDFTDQAINFIDDAVDEKKETVLPLSRAHRAALAAASEARGHREIQRTL